MRSGENAGDSLRLRRKRIDGSVATKRRRKEVAMKHLLALLCVILVLAACGAEPAPTPDLVATQIAVEEAAHATMTARAPIPSETSGSIETETPTETPRPSETPKPTSTPKPTNTPKPTSTPQPTSTPLPTDTPVPTVEPYDVWKQSARKDITYKMVDKSDAYLGERVCWRGEVFNIDESEGLTFLQAWYKDTLDAFVVIHFDTLPDIFEDDKIVACGYIDEKYEGTNAYGASIYQPSILGVYVQKPKPKAKATAKPKQPKPTPALAKIGEQVQAGNWLFTVTDVQYHKALYLYDSVKVAMGVHAVLFIDITNQAPGTTHFGELWWHLRGAGGNEYDEKHTSRAAWQLGGKDTPWTDINPGQTAQIVVSFDVAEGAKGLQLYSGRLEKSLVLIGDAQPAQDQ
jgi:hypothetical protein